MEVKPNATKPHSVQHNFLLLDLTTLLLGHTNSPASSSSCLRVLSSDTETPVVTETAMSADLLQAFEIVTKLGVDTVGKNLRIFAIHNITLTIQEPAWDFVLGRVLDDGDNALKLFGSEFTSALVEIHIGLLAHKVGVSSSHTLYLSQRVHHFRFAFNICVEQTENVLEVRLLSSYERHDGRRVTESSMPIVLDEVLKILSVGRGWVRNIVI